MQSNYRVDELSTNEDNEVFAKCHDNIYDEDIDKYLGDPNTIDGKLNAAMLLQDISYNMTDDMRQEIVNMFKLNNFNEEDEAMSETKSLNISEALNKIDHATNNKYDLRNLYESCKLTEKEKIELAKVIYDNENPKMIYDTLNQRYVEEFGFNEEYTTRTGWWSVEIECTLEGDDILFDNLSETTQEHIAESIKNGYVSGEIAEVDPETDDTLYGWWGVEFDITLDNEDYVRFDDLDEVTQEHIADSIKDGYTSGEIVEEFEESLDSTETDNKPFYQTLSQDQLGYYEKEVNDYLKAQGEHTYVYANHEGDLEMAIEGDWKHDHLYMSNLIKEFFYNKGIKVQDTQMVTNDNGSDYYAATHIFSNYAPISLKFD